MNILKSEWQYSKPFRNARATNDGELANFDPKIGCQDNVHWAIGKKGSKSAKSAYSPIFVTLAFRNGVEYRNFDFKLFNVNDLPTLCKNLVNFGPITPEFKRLKTYTAR